MADGMMVNLSELVQIWPPEERATAVAVALAESGGNPQARALTPWEDSRGLWQINTLAHPQYDAQALYDPLYNAQAAYALWQAQGWQPWTAYTSGAYRRFLGQDAEVGGGLAGASVASSPAATQASATPATLSSLAPLLLLLAALWALEVL